MDFLLMRNFKGKCVLVPIIIFLYCLLIPSNLGIAKTYPIPKVMSVRVTVWDDTEKTPVHNRAEIWLKGHGSWFLKSELKYGGAVKTLGNLQSGVKNSLYLYPDSRDGKEFMVPFVLTEDMNPKGSARDMITINISDKEIKFLGLPIEKATGEVEMKFIR